MSIEELRQQADRNIAAFNALSQAERDAVQAADDAEEDAALEGLDEFMLIGSGCDGWQSRWG